MPRSLFLASCRALPEPDPDAAPLLESLAAAGIDARVCAWDDPGVDWSAARLTVLRSTWNYPRKPEAFKTWLGRAASSSELWNPLPVVRWNAHKGYLLELERRGVPIAPTELVVRGSNRALCDICSARRWTDVIVKPAVSAASYRTRRFGPEEFERGGEAHLRRLASAGDVLVQQYLPSVEGYGERALVWIDGRLTHAVRKAPRLEGDDEAVSPQRVPITEAEAALAGRAIGAVSGPLLYARVDLAPAPDGRPVLMELELIEPSLFFTQCTEALERFVGGIEAKLRNGARLSPPAR